MMDNQAQQQAVKSAIDQYTIDIIRRIQKNIIALNECYVEREDVIDLIFLCLIANKNLLLIGPPGVAKSMMIKDFTSIFDGKYFYIQVNKTTTPSEVNGPVSYEKYKKGIFERVTTGKLPWANIAFLDEVGNASSPVQNGWNELLNEGTYNGVPCDLLMTCGATNFIAKDVELDASYDRWTGRYYVTTIQDPDNFLKLFNLPKFVCQNKITIDEIKDLKILSQSVDISQVTPLMVELWDLLKSEGVELSDRRWNQGKDLVRAQALLNERMVAERDDVMVLIHVLWEEEKQIKQVMQILEETISPVKLKMRDLMQQAKQIHDDSIILDPMEPNESQQILEALQRFKSIEKEYSVLLNKQGLSPVSKGFGEQMQKIVVRYRTNLNKVLFPDT